MNSRTQIRRLLSLIIQLLLLRFCKTSDMKVKNLKLKSEPGFVGHLKNVTVPEGRDVILSCTVKNLGPHKVAWIHYHRSAILTVMSSVITRNPRIGVSTEGNNRTWNLHIRNVQRSDQGAYMCQINTEKAKTRMGYINVVVPPTIEDNMSSGDKVKTEGSNVSLACAARGSPKPTVIWKREDGQNINIDKSNNFSVPHVEGDTLHLFKVSRLDMGAYMCIASNDVPPAVSKRIKLGIDFPPMMWVPAQQTSARLNSSITLTCFVEANPEALTYWEHNGRMIQSGTRFSTSTTHGTPAYKIEMKLMIKRLLKEDFGMYKCTAKNPRGLMDGTITITEDIPPTTTTLEPPTTTIDPKVTEKKRRKHRKNRNKETGSKTQLNNSIDNVDLLEEMKKNSKSNKNWELDKERKKSNIESNPWLNPRNSAKRNSPTLFIAYLICISTQLVIVAFSV